MIFWFILALSCNGPVCGIAPYGQVKYEQKAACEKVIAQLNHTYKHAHAKCEEGKA